MVRLTENVHKALLLHDCTMNNHENCFSGDSGKLSYIIEEEREGVWTIKGTKKSLSTSIILKYKANDIY